MNQPAEYWLLIVGHGGCQVAPTSVSVQQWFERPTEEAAKSLLRAIETHDVIARCPRCKQPMNTNFHWIERRES